MSSNVSNSLNNQATKPEEISIHIPTKGLRLHGIDFNPAKISNILGTHVITFPSSMSFKVDENVYDGTWESVLYGVDIEESESQKMKIGSKIDLT